MGDGGVRVHSEVNDRISGQKDTFRDDLMRNEKFC